MGPNPTDSILVTGASGLLGATLLQVARSAGRQVVGQYRQHRIDCPGVTTAPADLTDPADVGRLFDRAAPAWVVHSAAATDVDWCERNPSEAHRMNVDASRSVARQASRRGARMLHISTDAVFDGSRGDYSEDDAVHPINVYARTKVDAEAAVRAEIGSALIARVNIFGWNYQPKKSLGEWFLAELSAGRTVLGFTDVIFSPLVVDDLSLLLLAMMERCTPGTYHVAAADSCSKFDFGRRIARAFGLDESLVRPGTTGDLARAAARPKNLSLNTAKIARALGRAMPAIDDGIAAFRARRDSPLCKLDKGLTHAEP